VTRKDGLRVIVNDEESKDDDTLKNINILKVWQNDLHLVYYCLDDATNLSKNIITRKLIICLTITFR
jgi:hypothetical protein